MRTILSAIFVSAMCLALPGGAFAAGGYIQGSSEQDQIVKEVNKPQLVTMNSTDAAKGLKNANGVVTLDQNFERPKGPSCLARSQGDATREVHFDI